VGELAERVRTAGVEVRLEIDEDLGELPIGVSLGVYRIVQESLTNTLKHAGRGASASVRLRRDADAVLIEVTDDGAGRELVPKRGLTRVSGGNGLIGMRERAHVFGGTLDVGPAPGGGWRVLAKLPVRWRSDSCCRRRRPGADACRIPHGARCAEDIDVVGEAPTARRRSNSPRSCGRTSC